MNQDLITTSVKIDKELHTTLKYMKINISGLTNELLQKWLKDNELTEEEKINKEIEDLEIKMKMMVFQIRLKKDKIEEMHRLEKARLKEEETQKMIKAKKEYMLSRGFEIL